MGTLGALLSTLVAWEGHTLSPGLQGETLLRGCWRSPRVGLFLYFRRPPSPVVRAAVLGSTPINLLYSLLWLAASQVRDA